MQFKQSMERIHRLESNEEEGKNELTEGEEDRHNEEEEDNQLLSALKSRVLSAAKVLVPLKILLLALKVFLLIYFLDEVLSLLRMWPIPLLGLFSSLITSEAPVSSGIISIPLLTLLGFSWRSSVGMSLGSLAVGGCVEYSLSYSRSNSVAFIWEVVPYILLPSSLGALLSVFIEFPSEKFIQLVFELYCLSVVVFIVLARHRGGFGELFNELKEYLPQNSFCNNVAVNNEEDDINDMSFENRFFHWAPITVVLFFLGLFVVPVTGVGISFACFIYLGLMGHSEIEAMVTSAVLGGWTSIVPFVMHVGDAKFSWSAWLMIVIGEVVGRLIAPTVKDYVGIDKSLAFLCFFLFLQIIFMIIFQ